MLSIMSISSSPATSSRDRPRPPARPAEGAPPTGSARSSPPRRPSTPEVAERRGASATYFLRGADEYPVRSELTRSIRPRPGATTGTPLARASCAGSRTRSTVPVWTNTSKLASSRASRGALRTPRNAPSAAPGAAPAGPARHRPPPGAPRAAVRCGQQFDPVCLGQPAEWPTDDLTVRGQHPRTASLRCSGWNNTVFTPGATPDIGHAVRGSSAHSQSMGQGRARLCSCRVHRHDGADRRAFRAGTTDVGIELAPPRPRAARSRDELPGGRHRRRGAHRLATDEPADRAGQGGHASTG